MARKDARLGLTLTKQEKEALGKIAEIRRTSEAAVVRWLISQEAQRWESQGAQLCSN